MSKPIEIRKPIEAYYPKKPQATKLVQATIDAALVTAVDRVRKSGDLTWNELMTALFEHLLAESKKKGT